MAEYYDLTETGAEVQGAINKAEEIDQVYTGTEKTKLSNIEAEATKNDTDANLKNRANHTGTQSADTIIDGTTNKVYTATEQAKLSGIEAGAEVNKPQSFVLACSDETSDLTTGSGKLTFRMPYAFTITEVRSSVTTAPTGSVLTVDINQDGTSIFTTNLLTIDDGEKTSETASVPPNVTTTSLTDDAEITIDIDQIGSTVAGAGLKVAIIGTVT